MNSIGATLLSFLLIFILFGTKRQALIAILAGALYLTQAQSLSIGGINMFAIRLIEVLAIARIIIKGEYPGKPTKIDYQLLILYAYTTIIFCLRSSYGQTFSIGVAADSLLSYFIFRSLISGVGDLESLMKPLVILLLPFTILLAIEMSTHNNPFAIIGGLSFVEREGRLRCMGSFRHPSLLGTVGAAFVSIFIAAILSGKARVVGIIGIFLCLAIVYFANSGGPLSATAIGILAWVFWPLRYKLKYVRIALVVLLLFLAIAMKAPIWYLPAKISSIAGGDGWHRSFLMEVAFQHIDKWWLAGMDLLDTANWFDYQLGATGTADITNQFLLFGLDSGFITIILFIYLLSTTFSTIGTLYKDPDRDNPESATDSKKYFLWGLGCAVIVHIFTWIGITYIFDQTYIIWFLQLAIISSSLENRDIREPQRGEHVLDKAKTIRTGWVRVAPKKALGPELRNKNEVCIENNW